MTNATTPAVEIRGVHKRYGDTEVLHDVSVEIAPGTVTCLIGPSGAGKSTLLKCINALEVPSRGRVLLDGELVGVEETSRGLRLLRSRDVARQRARTGMVFQRFELFPHRTAVDNVALPLVLVRRLSWSAARARAREELIRVGLGEKLASYPSQLSGGQQQRVGIARALAGDPQVLLLDEPTSALDPELVGEVLEVMSALARSGRTMVVVTHEIGFARELADVVVFMDEGRLVEVGPPAQVIDAPRHPRTRSFISRVIA